MLTKLFYVEIKQQIKTYEIDANRHVSNIIYIKWLEDLRIKILEEFLPVEILYQNNFHPVLRSTEIEYKVPLYLKDKEVTTSMWISSVEKDLIWNFSANFFIKTKIIANAKQKGVVFSVEENKAVKIPYYLMEPEKAEKFAKGSM